MAACNQEGVAADSAAASRFASCHSKQANKKLGATAFTFRRAGRCLAVRRAPGFVGALHHHVQQRSKCLEPDPVFAVALPRPGQAGLQQRSISSTGGFAAPRAAAAGWAAAGRLASSAKPGCASLAAKRGADDACRGLPGSAAPASSCAARFVRLQCRCGNHHHLRAWVVVHGVGEVTPLRLG